MARKIKQEAAATRQKLLDAAEKVFYARGVSAATLADVAREADVTRGAVYWHFRDKMDLFEAMMQRVVLPVEQAVQGHVAVQAEQPVRRLLAVCESVLRIASEDERARRVFEIALFRIEYVGDQAVAQQRNLESMARFVAHLEQGFNAVLTQAVSEDGREGRAAVAPQALPVSPAQAARGMAALVEGLLRTWLLHGGKGNLLTQGMQLLRIYLRGLGLEERP